MKVVLFRHAERESLGTSNPTLTRRGIAQAELLVKMVDEKKFPGPTKLMASPRLRSQMTLSPLAKARNLDIQVRPELNERLSSESATQFTSRVSRFLAKCESLGGPLFLCTHLDWIEEALREIPSESDLSQSQYQTWAPAQYMTFTVEEGLWLLEDYGRIEC